LLQPWYLICCCWTIPWAPYVTNEWCFVAKQAPALFHCAKPSNYLAGSCPKFHSIQSNLSQNSFGLQP
jgi:hypothetical protein